MCVQWYRSGSDQVKLLSLSLSIRLHLRSMTFDLFAEVSALVGLLCNMDLVITAFL